MDTLADLPPISSGDAAASASYKRPIEAVAGARIVSLGAVSRAIAAATIMTMLLGADAASRWAGDLPISSTSDIVIAATETWRQSMERFGITRIAEASRRGIERVEQWRW